MKKLLLPLLTILVITSMTIDAKNISAIFFDIEAIFVTDDMKASSYVGKINSLRYLSHVGHLPNQETLFKNLKNIKALSHQTTYNNNLEMPLILSDWLAQIQTNSKIKDIIQKYLTNKNLSDIETKVLIAIVNMMLTPQNLADTQKIRPKIEHLIKSLSQKGYKLYLVGNWAHIGSLKSYFPDIFRYFSECIVSGDNHMLKPYQNYYQDVLIKTGIESENALWIETESKFASKAKHYGYNTLLFGKDYNSLISGLYSFGISA